MAAFFVHILLSPVVLLGRGIQTAVANIIGARVHPHLEKLLKEEKKSSVPVVVGAVASTAVVVGANLAYKASMSKNDKWRYENYEIVNSIVDLKRLTPLMGSSSFLEGRCYGLTVNKMSGEVITSLVALNNLGSNGSTPFRTMETAYPPFFVKNLTPGDPKFREGKTEEVNWKSQCYARPQVYSLMEELEFSAPHNDMQKMLRKLFTIHTTYVNLVNEPIAIIHLYVGENNKKLWTCAVTKREGQRIKVIEIDSINHTCTREIDLIEYIKGLKEREITNIIYIEKKL